MVFQDPMTSQIPVLTYDRQMSDIQYRRKELSIEDIQARKSDQDHAQGGGYRIRKTVFFSTPIISAGDETTRRDRHGTAFMDPLLLIADEPTTALDVTLEAQIIHLIQELRELVDATVVVSHNLGLIAELCDQVVVMYAGEVVEYGVSNLFIGLPHPLYTGVAEL